MILTHSHVPFLCTSEPCLPCQASGIGFSSNSIHFPQDKGQEALYNEQEVSLFPEAFTWVHRKAVLCLQ